MTQEKSRRLKRLLPLIVVLVTVMLTVAVCAVYLSDYYHADNQAIAEYMRSGATWTEQPDGTLIYKSEGATAGLILYPGGKVEHTAYLPLMKACADRGILCVTVKMPFNLAVFDVNAANGIREQFPEIESWYIGGHSLGGAMASFHLESHHADFDGLILLGSYSSADLSETALRVLSIYGSEDNVLNREKYEESKTNLPDGFSEYVIAGGCHAYFGMYGEQEGDGKATILPEGQLNTTAELIEAFIEGRK